MTLLLRHYYVIITSLLHHYYSNNGAIITVIMGLLLPIITRSIMGNNESIITHYEPTQLADGPVIEAEPPNYLTGEPTRKWHVIHKTSGSKAAPLVLVESKTMNWDSSARAATEDASPHGTGTGAYTRPMSAMARSLDDLDHLDGRQVAVDRHQVGVMLLLIP